MEAKKKAAVAGLKKTMAKSHKSKTVKASGAKKRTREEIDKMFAFDFACDCSHCSHHCGDAQ